MGTIYLITLNGKVETPPIRGVFVLSNSYDKHVYIVVSIHF
jgi:hypothetical protein